jgi:sulfonate transport system permease protein
MRTTLRNLNALGGAAGSVLVLGGFIALWWAASTSGWVNRAFLPTPQATLASLVQGLAGGDLAAYTWATLSRMFSGWVLASALGIAPTLEFIRPLPASAVMPLAIALFGLSGGMVLAVVAFGAMWPVLLATLHGLANVHKQLREVSRSLELSHLAFVLKIGLPNAMPDILAGMRLSMTVSLIVSVVGEMIASQAGLGQAILLAARSFQASELFAGIVLLGAMGFASNVLLALAEKSLLRWQRP